MERLQKVLAHAGIASRRKCEELILEGKVRINGPLGRHKRGAAAPQRLLQVDKQSQAQQKRGRLAGEAQRSGGARTSA